MTGMVKIRREYEEVESSYAYAITPKERQLLIYLRNPDPPTHHSGLHPWRKVEMKQGPTHSKSSSEIAAFHKLAGSVYFCPFCLSG
jgi:hypothetical protein